MSSTETAPKFEYVTERPPYREIESIDVTREILARCTIEHPIIENYDFAAAYNRYWARKGLPERHTAVVRNPNVRGEPYGLPPTSPFEGALASHPGTNTLSIRDTRSWAFRNPNGTYTLMKGTGNLELAENDTTPAIQFGQRPKKYKSLQTAIERGWGSTGGLLEVDALEEARAFMLADLYQQIFIEDPPMRLPAYILDINQGLAKDGSLDPNFPTEKYHHVQAQYEVDTPVRTIYGAYISDLEVLWIGLDLETDEGKNEALNYLNTTFSAYVRRHSKGPIKPVGHEDLKQVLDLIQKRREVYKGSDVADSDFTPEVNEQIADLRYKIAEAGTVIASKFYEKNSDAVNKAAKREITALAKMIGMSLALGIDIHQCANRKDLSGGRIGDLGPIKYNYAEDFVYINSDSANAIEFEDKLRKAKDLTPMISVETGIVSIQYLATMLGIPNHTSARLVEIYMNEIVDSFKKTESFVERANKGQIPNAPKFSPKHLSAVRNYYRNFADITNYVGPDDEINSRRLKFLALIYSATRSINTPMGAYSKGKQSTPEFVHLGKFGMNRIPLTAKEAPLELADATYIDETFVARYSNQVAPWFAISMDFGYDTKTGKFVIKSLPIEADMEIVP